MGLGVFASVQGFKIVKLCFKNVEFSRGVEIEKEGLIYEQWDFMQELCKICKNKKGLV